ncbi:hypothetical protein V3C99_014599, partial [Haemonchus contortus]
GHNSAASTYNTRRNNAKLNADNPSLPIPRLFSRSRFRVKNPEIRLDSACQNSIAGMTGSI